MRSNLILKYKGLNYINNRIDNYIYLLNKLSLDQMKFYQSGIKTHWNYSNQKLRVRINDKLPIGKIKINFKNKIDDKKLKIIIKNKNKFYTHQKIPFSFDGTNSIVMETILVADRIPIQNSKIKPVN